jgi:hypothetical protein
MKRIVLILTVALLMVTMLLLAAAPAFGGKVRFWTVESGTPVPSTVCEVVADKQPGGGLVEWRNGVCWVNHPVSASNF